MSSNEEKEESQSLLGKDVLKSLIEKYKGVKVTSELEKSISAGRVVSLPLASLSLFPILEEKDASRLEKKDLSKDKDGIEIPVFVYAMDGKNYVVSGLARYFKAKRSGAESVPCLYLQGEEEEMILYVISNLLEDKDNQLLLASALKKLEEEYGLKEKDIRELTGLSHGQAANLIRISALGEDVKELMRQGQLTLAKARLLINMNSDKAYQLALKFITLDVRQCEQLAREAKEEKDSSVKYAGKGYTYKVQGRSLVMDFVSEDELKAFLKKIEG